MRVLGWISTILALTAALVGAGASDDPTFLIYKYQHVVGAETDRCEANGAGTPCHASFQLHFTGSSISLDADISTDAARQPLSFTAKGRNSTRSSEDVSVAIEGPLATVHENGIGRTVPVPSTFFTIQQDVPFIAQELLLAYWRAHHEPGRIALLPIGALRAATTIPAKVLGVTDSGAVEVGKRADLVVLDANPLVDISNVRRVRWTAAGGKLLQSAGLWTLVDIHPPGH